MDNYCKFELIDDKEHGIQGRSWYYENHGKTRHIDFMHLIMLITELVAKSATKEVKEGFVQTLYYCAGFINGNSKELGKLVPLEEVVGEKK